MTDALPPVPRQTLNDLAHALVSGAIGSAPGVGGVGAALFAHFIESPIGRRRDEWMQAVGERLAAVAVQGGVSLEKLQEDDGFIDTVMQATHIAMRHSEKTKREALRNGIANSATKQRPDDAERQVYLSLIDRFTEWHLRLLNLFHNPVRWYELDRKQFPQLAIGSLSSILEEAYPELRNRRDFYDVVWRELYLAGLVNTEGLHVMMSAGGMRECRTSSRGQSFLNFIAEPSDSGTADA